MKIMRVGLSAVSVALILLTACGSDKPVQVSVSPVSATMDQGATQPFTATVTGSRNSAVMWSIQEGTAGGTISAQGVYTAPAAAGFFHVVAKSVADSTRVATAAVTVRAVSLNVTPISGDLVPGATQQFTATVTGSVNHNVTWSVQEGAAGGSITTDGTYTAPPTTGTFHIVATSVADGTKTVTVAVAVATLAVLISPRGVGLLPGGTRTFSASVSGSMDDRVSWAVQEGSVGGVITSDGSYTAPAQTGQYHVIATSLAHPGVSGVATVLVTNSGFTDAGNMTQSRSYHTATLLPNGDVLLAGGGSAATYWSNTATAELFDHVTGSFRATGEMKSARDGHTATLLPNGKVLIAGGGMGGWSSLNSAELYDPATGQFAPTGNMVAPRGDHTATLLPNGKVLIAGGGNLWDGETNEAELYDPASGTFTSTGSMSSARMWHRATLLPDGRVLVTGGTTGDSAEIYDPATGTFAAAGSLVGARYYHTATLLADGRILLAGGQWWHDTITWQTTYLDDAEVFNPASGQFSSLGKMNTDRASHTATLLANGQVLLVGGADSDGPADNTAELFDPAIAVFLSTGSMAKARVGHTATLLLDGRVLVAGGSDDKSAELYVQRP